VTVKSKEGSMRRYLIGIALVAIVAAASVGVALSPSGSSAAHARKPRPPAGIHKIKHVIVIMQENRSFDQYFGTYPGADGIPRRPDGTFAVCVPNPATGGCEKPFHDTNDLNAGGPHGQANAVADIHGGAMDGFVASAENAKVRGCKQDPNNPICSQRSTNPDVMGYHDGRDIPNYWAYARTFVLQDHMYEPNASWSLPAHLFMVSEWSAHCTNRDDPFSCANALQNPGPPPDQRTNLLRRPPKYAWTDLTYLLHKHGIPWRYYVFSGTEPDCENDAMICEAVKQGAKTPGIWNPLPFFTTVQDDNQVGNIVSLSQYFRAARAGTLPAVSWINPTGAVSEHPPGLVTAGQTYVTKLVNAAMSGPEWRSTAIFLAWDDWGGFYDHLQPPVVDQNGYGLRVPGLVISAYARRGFVDHQVLSFDAYVKFIEDDFLHSQRLDPKTDGRPDPRPDVRENAPILGDLTRDFNFDQKPRRPLILPTHPVTDLH
jgi:phospholipase C